MIVLCCNNVAAVQFEIRHFDFFC